MCMFTRVCVTTPVDNESDFINPWGNSHLECLRCLKKESLYYVKNNTKPGKEIMKDFPELRKSQENFLY